MSHYILIVEDNKSTRELYVDMLETAKYDVRAMRTGQEVIDYFDAPIYRMPDILILDINLPERSGVYVMKYLRGKLQLAHLKILVVTANQIAAGIPEMELADVRLIKPFTISQFLNEVKALLAYEKVVDSEQDGQTPTDTQTESTPADDPPPPQSPQPKTDTTKPADEPDTTLSVPTETPATKQDDAPAPTPSQSPPESVEVKEPESPQPEEEPESET